MNGCSTKDFARKLKKLNPLLRVDHTRVAWTDPEYPECGLYFGNKYLFGVPQGFVPVYSIAGIDFNSLVLRDDFETINYVDRYGFCPNGKQNLEAVLWRGQKVILSELCRRGLINREKAQKEFKIEFYERQLEYPRLYVQRKVE